MESNIHKEQFESLQSFSKRNTPKKRIKMNEDTVKKLIITSASVIVGYSLKQIAEKKWMNIYNEEPPTTKSTEEIDWMKVVLWSVITGTIISSAKLATKRYLTLKLDT